MNAFDALESMFAGEAINPNGTDSTRAASAATRDFAQVILKRINDPAIVGPNAEDEVDERLVALCRGMAGGLALLSVITGAGKKDASYVDTVAALIIKDAKDLYPALLTYFNAYGRGVDEANKAAGHA